MFFAMGRRGLIDARAAQIHPANLTPSAAVLAVGGATAACMFLGGAILVPITEVGSVAAASGWLMTCAAYFSMRPGAREQLVAAVGLLVALTMVLMKVVPFVPGHFSPAEWAALAIWCVMGGVLGWKRVGAKR
jgi:hypothetical protein